MEDGLDKLLLGEEPKNEHKEDSASFRPKFNVREEFVLWVNRQFPNLKKHSRKKKIYQELEERREEVYQAGLGAGNHGADSTEACASARLYSGWKEFEAGFKETGDPKTRARSLEGFVNALKDLSHSLGGNEHFTEAGRFLDGRGYFSEWHGNLNALVYRVGNGEDSKIKYEVLEEGQKKEVTPNAVLIGEFNRLTPKKLRDLKKIAELFRGSEAEFIARVDRDIPAEGSRGYSPSAYPYSDLPAKTKVASGIVRESRFPDAYDWGDFYK